MSSWICDGVPKDGKDYSDLGGKHEPISNDFPDCQYCGLPQEAMNPSTPSGGKTIIINGSGKKPKFILLGIFTGLLVLIGGSAAYFSGLFSGDRHLQTYEEAVASGEEALSIVQTHRTPEELAEAQEYLSLAITNLSKIPQKASIYPDAEAKIADYDNLSVQIANKLSSNSFQLCAVEPKPEKICRF